MPWVKIDDRFAEHPKVVKAGPLAMAMYVAGLCYCNRNGTDGVIPEVVVDRLIPISTRQAPGVAGSLVTAGLWEPTDDGFLVHDYADFQPTSDRRADLSAKRAEAGRKGAAARWNGDNKAPEPKANAIAICQRLERTFTDDERYIADDWRPVLEELQRRLASGEAITSPANLAVNLAEKRRRERVAKIRRAAEEKAARQEAEGLDECPHGMARRDCPDCLEATRHAIAEAKAALGSGS